MKKKIIYMLALICCLNLYSSAKQHCSNPVKKSCDKAAAAKKQPVKVKKNLTTSTRPLHFYLFNI
jgi:hypothetical protein